MTAAMSLLEPCTLFTLWQRELVQLRQNEQ